MIRQILTVCAAGIGVGGVLAAAPPVAPTLAPLVLTATAVPLDAQDPARTTVGRLAYRGGLVLRSPDAAFGGLSGLRIRADGWALAISDTGNWVTFKLVETGGRLTGAVGGHIAPILDAGGRPPVTKEAGDAEGLEIDGGATRVVFEQDHRVQLYDGIDITAPATLQTRARAIVRQAATASWPDNGGGEAIVVLGDGREAIFQEGGVDAEGYSPVVVRGPVETVQWRYAPPDGHLATDAARLADGRLIVVNRRFSPLSGVSVAITLVEPGATMRGTEIARLVPPLSVDNFEGVAVTVDGARTFVWLVSDDNFAGFQRTLLLKFELLAATSPTASSRVPR